MNMNEYEKIKDLNYFQYCNYLQSKYGIGKCDYMTKNWRKNSTITRTNEGLICHHKYEYCAMRLSDIECAKNHPYYFQLAKNIVYCDYLEHLFLHILICEIICKNNIQAPFGIGGIFDFIIPELNDVYSGWKTNENWRKNCHSIILNDKNVYLVLLKRFKKVFNDNDFYHEFYDEDCFYSSFNEENSNEQNWSRLNNIELFTEISQL